MAKTKKKVKSVAKKAKKVVKKVKAAVKKVKKVVKSPAKKKARSVSRKKTSAPAKKKASVKVKKMPEKMPAPPQGVPQQEVPQTEEHLASLHNEPRPQLQMEEKRKLEQALLNRKDVKMKGENEKMKSMSKRQGMKPVFHGLRGN